MKHISNLPRERMVIGAQSLNIVTRRDYVRWADVCLRHAIFNRTSIYIMLEDCTLAALLMAHGPGG